MQRLGPSSAPICALDLPDAIRPRVLNALKADPKTVDLREKATHFYDLAARVLELFEEEEIVDVLLEVCGVSGLLKIRGGGLGEGGGWGW